MESLKLNSFRCGTREFQHLFVNMINGLGHQIPTITLTPSFGMFKAGSKVAPSSHSPPDRAQSSVTLHGTSAVHSVTIPHH
jgi:hypothetical protein